jgi:hypothetical protein
MNPEKLVGYLTIKSLTLFLKDFNLVLLIFNQ